MTDFFVIADDEIVLAFRMVGVDGRPASGRQEALAAFRFATGCGSDPSGKDCKGMGPKVLILTEEVADLLGEAALEWQLSGGFPLIVEIPSPGGPRPGRKGLVDAVREAVGVGF
jgi:vacuolar-type H+-ATPase subunit F/Vma7